MKVFFSSTNAGTGALQRSQALDIVPSNIKWIAADKENDLNRNLFSSLKTVSL